MNGIIKIDDYFQREGISNSFLKSFERSPAHAFSWKESSKSMDKGTMIHEFILEPDEFEKKYVVAPIECQNRKNIPYPAFAKANPDKEILLTHEMADLITIKERVKNYNFHEFVTVGEILGDSKKEHSFFWESQGIQKKGKMDILAEFDEFNAVIDLKTTDNALMFQKKITDYGYHRQAAWYSDAITNLTDKPTYFYFLVIETGFPFGVKMFELTEDFIQVGRLKNYNVVESYKEWVANGSDKTIIYAPGVETIAMPKWMEN